jgi:hypothetical protein
VGQPPFVGVNIVYTQTSIQPCSQQGETKEKSSVSEIPLILNNADFWDEAPCESCKNRRSSETSVYNKPTCRHIPEDGTLHSHRRVNLKSGWILLRTMMNRKRILIGAALRYNIGTG